MKGALKKILSVLIIANLLLCAGCDFSKSKSTAGENNTIVFSQFDEEGLTVEKVGDGSLLVVRYNEDYYFDDYLKKGFGTDEDARSFLEEKGIKMSKDFDHLESKLTKMLNKRFNKASPFFTPLCSDFSAANYKGEYIFGRNEDFFPEDSVVLLHTMPENGYASVSTVDGAIVGYFNKPDEEIDKDTLLSAPYLPLDGMNECGLAVALNAEMIEEIFLDPQKVSITSAFSTMRLLLDHAQNVEEAVSLLEKHKMNMSKGVAHYMISDASGKSAVVEYDGNKINVMRNSYPWQVMTNFRMSVLKDEAYGRSACGRYWAAFKTLEEANGVLSEDEAMNLLDRITLPNILWTNLYNKSTGEIKMTLRGDFKNVYNVKLEMKK